MGPWAPILQPCPISPIFRTHSRPRDINLRIIQPSFLCFPLLPLPLGFQFSVFLGILSSPIRHSCPKSSHSSTFDLHHYVLIVDNFFNFSFLLILYLLSACTLFSAFYSPACLVVLPLCFLMTVFQTHTLQINARLF